MSEFIKRFIAGYTGQPDTIGTSNAYQSILDQSAAQDAERAGALGKINQFLGSADRQQIEQQYPSVDIGLDPGQEGPIQQPQLDRETALQMGLIQPELTPNQRWKRQVDALITSGNESLQKKGLSMLSQYQQRATEGSKAPTPSNAAKMAGELGLKRGTKPYNDFIKRYAFKKDFEVSGDKPMSVADLNKVEIPDPNNPGRFIKPPVSTTPNQLREMGGRIRETVGADAAGRYAMLDTASKAFNDIEQAIFRSDGTIDKQLIKDSFLMSKDPTPGKIASKWWTQNPQAAEVAQGFEMGIQAITRLETGAAMPESEIENTRSRFLPGPADSDELVQRKWNAYKYFIQNAKYMINPSVFKGSSVESLTDEVRKAADRALQEFEVGGGGDSVPSAPQGFY